MGLFDILFGDNNHKTDEGRDWDRSVFDTDRFRSRGVAIGLIGKMYQRAIASPMALSIRSLMRMENGSKQNFRNFTEKNNCLC